MTKKAVNFLLKFTYRQQSDIFRLRRLARVALEAATQQGCRSDELTELRRFLHELDHADLKFIQKILEETPDSPEYPTEDESG
jgi:hypothetical protein